MLICAVIQNEEIRNQRMIAQYEAQIAALPKGSLICRRGYYYLKYRKDGKVCDKYIGKDAERIAEVRRQLELRRHCESMLSVLRQEQKKIQKIQEDLT